MIIDLEKASEVLQSLPEEKVESLGKLWDSIQQFKSDVAPDLNPYEFKYVMQTLITQQVVGADPSEIENARKLQEEKIDEEIPS